MTQSNRNYYWDIDSLVWRDQGILPNVVTDIHWRLTCSNPVTGASAIVIGATDLDTVSIDPNQFVSVEAVTEDLARTWLMARMTAEFTQAQLDEADRRLTEQESSHQGRPWVQ